MMPLRLKHARRPVEIARDAAGVPHVRAGNFLDALYGLGYMHALDRRTQLFFGRTIAEGRAWELLSPSPTMLARDRFFRTMGLGETARRETERVPAREFGELTIYAQGVNDGFVEAGRTWPMFFTGFRPEPWDVRSVLLMGGLLALGGLALGQQRAERTLIDLIRAGVSTDLLRELYAPHFGTVDTAALARLKAPSAFADEILENCGPLPRLAGSNAFAVAPARSRSGHALLASDPHLETSRLPATWYEAVLEWPEGSLLGATLPGTPMFAVARTPRLAWGVTYTMGDICDYFLEDCKRIGGRTFYRRGESWLPFDERVETLHRAGREPIEIPVRTNSVGVLQGDPQEQGDGIYLSWAWTGTSGGLAESVATWLRLPECGNVRDAQVLVRACPQPPLSWIFADDAGNIGRQVNGRFPRRAARASGLTPLPAWDEANHWRGFLPVALLPSEFNPPRGWIVSANEQLDALDGTPLSTLPAAPYRRDRLAELLAATPRVTLDDCRRFQYDTFSVQARGWLERLGSDLPADLRRRLAGWRGDYGPDDEQATLFHAFYEQLLLVLFGGEPAAGGIGERRLRYLFRQPMFTMLFLGRVDDLLWDEPRRRSLPLPTLTAAIAAAAERVRRFDPPPWGRVNRVDLKNAFLEGAIGDLFGLHERDLPVRGCHATPHQGHVVRTERSSQAYLPSYHFVADLGSPGAWTNLPGGPSEGGGSRWYRTELDRWRNGTLKHLAPGPPDRMP